MDGQIWSWVVTIVGITGFFFVGKKLWWAWYINIGNQALWMTYAVVTEQWGFILASLFYTVVFVKNAVVWTREHFSKPRVSLYTDEEKAAGSKMLDYAKEDVKVTEYVFEKNPRDLYSEALDAFRIYHYWGQQPDPRDVHWMSVIDGTPLCSWNWKGDYRKTQSRSVVTCPFCIQELSRE